MNGRSPLNNSHLPIIASVQYFHGSHLPTVATYAIPWVAVVERLHCISVRGDYQVIFPSG